MDWYGVSGRKIKNSYLYDYNSGGSLRGKLNGVKVDYWTPFNPSNEFPRPSYKRRPCLFECHRYSGCILYPFTHLTIGIYFPGQTIEEYSDS